MVGWFTDLLRLAWGLLYWNFRKTVFRRRRDPCPCQAPSDSGRAGETHCEACSTWHQPWRFRRICPHLTRTPAGVRCGVDTAQIQTFWGRALAYYAGTALSIYLIAALGIFAGLRGIGYAVTPTDILWPPAWHRIDQKRAEFFFKKGATALEAGDIREALFALGVAHNLAPRDYATSALLARLYQGTQPALSDQLYAQTLQRHPDHATQTAQSWMRALLARGDFSLLQTLAFDRLMAGQENPAPWLHVLIFASRQCHDTAPIAKLATASAGEAWRPVLETELLWSQGKKDEVAQRLAQPGSGASPYIVRYQADLLLALDQPEAAVQRISAQTGVPDADRVRILFAAYARRGLHEKLRQDALRLLARQPSAAVVDLLASHLIRHPNAPLLADIVAQLRSTPLPATDEAFVAYTALFCAAGLADDKPHMDQLLDTMKQRSNAPLHALDRARDYFDRHDSTTRLGNILAPLALSLDATYAIYETNADRDTAR